MADEIQQDDPIAEQRIDQRDMLKDAVTKAIDDVTGTEEEIKNDTPTKEKEETSQDEDSPLTKEELKQAQQLFLSLKDPEQAPKVIEFIASQAGYKKIESQQEVEEAKDAVLEHLRENLGPDFDFLTPKLSKAINKILETKLNEHTRDIRADLAQERESKIRVETTSAYTTLSQKYFGKDEMPNEIMAEMSKLMEAYKPANGMTVSQYLSDMLQTAASRLEFDLKNVKKTAQNNERISKNRTDAVGRLASERGAVTESSVIGKPPNKKLSLNEAIEKSINELQEK